MVNVGAPMTEADADAYGKKLEAAMADQNAALVSALLRVDALAERCTSDLPLNKKNRDGFLTGFRQAGGGNFGATMLEACKNGGSYKYIRCVREEGQWMDVFRVLLGGEGGMNYHKVPIARFPDGEIAATDIYIMSNGEFYSQTIRRLVLGVVAVQDAGLIGKLDGSTKAYLENMEEFSAMGKRLRAGDNAGVLATYHSLPEAMQNEKLALIYGIQATAKLEDKDYLEMIDRYRHAFPDDAACDFLSIDYFLLKKDLPAADRAYANLSRAVGGDGYLDHLRAGMYIQAERDADAEKILTAAVAVHPDIVELYSDLIAVAEKQGRFADTAKWFKKLIEISGIAIDVAELKKEPVHAQFLASPEFRELQEWDGARKKQ